MALSGRRLGATASAIIAMASLSALGCAVQPPVFQSIALRLIVAAKDGAGAREERLSFFASVSDGDGIADIDYLYLVNDEAQLCWTMTPDDWTESDEGGSVWIGSNGLLAPGGAIPRGEYRAILVDKAGERSEKPFTLSAPETSAYDLPTAALEGASLKVGSPYPNITAFFFDAGGNVVNTAPVAKGSTPLDTLWAKAQWRTGADYVAVYGFDPKAEIGFFSWKIRLPD